MRARQQLLRMAYGLWAVSTLSSGIDSDKIVGDYGDVCDLWRGCCALDYLRHIMELNNHIFIGLILK